MAKQKGELVLHGKIGDMVFYKSRYGKIARRIGEVPIEKRRNAPSYARTRDNNSEFGYASRVGKLVRRGVGVYCPGVEVGATHNRLVRLIKNLLPGDTVSDRGKRRLTVENVPLLRGFSWKEVPPLHKVLRRDYSFALDATAGSASLSIASFVASNDLALGEGASHAELTLVLVAADFDRNSQTNVCDRSGMIALSDTGNVSINLSCSLSEFSGKVLVAGIGVQGYQMVGGQMMPLAERSVFEITMGAIGV